MSPGTAGTGGTAGTVEGATRIFPAAGAAKPPHAPGPGKRERDAPFYNPGMALNRDLSVLLVEAYAKARGRQVDVADALAGTGARAVRLAHEVQGDVVVHANDADPTAVAAMQKSVGRNGVPAHRVSIRHGEATAFLASRRFDVVDVDPYGSPAPFLDAALRATRHGGLVCLTATDTAALAGAFPRACLRRYAAEHRLHRYPWRAEVGLRILAGAAVRSAARFDRAAVPVLSVARGHWMRVVCRVGDGSQAADRAVARLGFARGDPESLLGSFVPRPQPAEPAAGPLWTGPLHDEGTVAGMAAAAAQDGRTLARGKEVDGLLPLLAAECAAPAFWVVPDLLQARLGPPPRRDRLLETLRSAGHAAARTHLDPQGVRTDADIAGLQEAWGASGPRLHPRREPGSDRATNEVK